MASSRRVEPSSSNSFADTPLHFFKVILPSTLEDKKLRIPEKFVKKFGDELSAVVKLTVPTGHAWHVGLKKDGKTMWFNAGWHDFVKYFSICAGYFLVFRYGKNSNFHVLIFDTTACEIQYPYGFGGPKSYEQNLGHNDEMKIDNSLENVKSIGKRCTSFETPKFKYPCKDEDAEEVKLRKRTVRTDERESAIDAANVFEPSNPFCRVVVQPSYLSTVFLPVCFSQKHFNGVSGFIKLQLSDGKQWPVLCGCSGRRITLKWRRFILENNLREGDVCVFEVLKSKDIVLKVTVFSVLESEEFVNRLSFGSAQGSNKYQKCVCVTSPRCKIEELEEINKSDAVGDESEVVIARHKVEAHSSDEKNERTKFYELELLDLLEDMGISVCTTFGRIASEERDRAAAAARLFRPKNPSFMVILQPHNLGSRRVLVPTKFAKKCLSRNSNYIKVQDSDGREWPGTTMWYGKCCYIKGLAGLIWEKNLDKGDICIFELITVNELLKISVFHASTA